MGAIILSLGLAHGLSIYLTYSLGHEVQLGFARQFDLGTENNIPTWYASTALLLCAGLLGLIATAKRQAQDPMTRLWGLLGCLFLALSIDEAASLHEQLGLIIEHVHRGEGWFYYGWVIPGIGVVGLLGIAYLRFLRLLPGRTRALFMLAASLYVGGALGFELIESRYEYLYGALNVTYVLFTLIEELLEMLGIAVFAYALARYLEQQVGRIVLTFADEEVPGLNETERASRDHPTA